MSPTSLHFLNFPCIVLFVFFQMFIPFAHPLSFRFDRDFGNLNISYEGDAKPSNGKIVFPASDSPYRVGWANYPKPLHLWDSCLTGSYGADFTTHFSFTIDNVNVSGGLAFFLVSVGYDLPPNSAGGELGLFNSTSDSDMTKNRIVMVEFNTSMQLVGICENSPHSSDNKSWDVKSHAGKTANVWITYKASTKNLSVFWTYENNPVFKGNSSLSSILDLKDVLPQYIKIGFSASTGSTHERYTIHSWDFHSNLTQSCHKMRRTILATSVAAGFLIMMLLMSIISWLVLKRRRIGNDQSHGNDADSESSISTNLERGALPRKFSYLELLAATNGFAKDRRLGQGGSGLVYKGTLSDLERPVAVKRIFTESEHSQSLFINEVKIISRLIHRNLVQFIGWCHEQGEFLLVYEHMTNGSLDHHLFGKGEALPWNARYKIASGLASALHYLHEEAEQYCVLHRDIKSANILLDTDFSTKLGDFGVAKLVDPRLTPRRTSVVGTYGYLAPEYANEGRASKESDMFSFGVVALEIACGRRTFQDGEFHVSLVTWVWELYLAGDILKAADEKLGMDFDEDEIRRLLVVGLWCAQPNDRERPKAGQVIKVLRLEAPLPELPHDMHDPGFHQFIPQSQDQSYCFQLTSSLDDLGRRPIKASLAAASEHLAGLLPLHLVYSQAHGTAIEDWIWSVGCNPFSVTSQGWHISQFQSDTIARSYIITTLEESIQLVNSAIHLLVMEHTMENTFQLFQGQERELVNKYNYVVSLWRRVSTVTGELRYVDALRLLYILEEASKGFVDQVNATITLLHPIHCMKERKVHVVFDVTTIPAFLVVLGILYFVLRPKRPKPKIN